MATISTRTINGRQKEIKLSFKSHWSEIWPNCLLYFLLINSKCMGNVVNGVYNYKHSIDPLWYSISQTRVCVTSKDHSTLILTLCMLGNCTSFLPSADFFSQNKLFSKNYIRNTTRDKQFVSRSGPLFCRT